VTEVVQYLPKKHEALSSNSSTTKKEKKKIEKLIQNNSYCITKVKLNARTFLEK
jgi:hypothetical protein